MKEDPTLYKEYMELLENKFKADLIHEIGHLLIPSSKNLSKEKLKEFYVSEEDFHHESDPQTECYFSQKFDGATQACERHVRILRNSIKRYFWYFDTEGKYDPPFSNNLEKIFGTNGPFKYGDTTSTYYQNMIKEEEKNENSDLKKIKFTRSQLYD